MARHHSQIDNADLEYRLAERGRKPPRLLHWGKVQIQSLIRATRLVRSDVRLEVEALACIDIDCAILLRDDSELVPFRRQEV